MQNIKPMAINYDQIVSEYARNRQLHPEVFKDLVSLSKVTTNDRVLEVGCGTGNYIIALDSLVSCSCWGVDPSAEMLSKAKERSNNIHFQLGRAETLEFKSNYFALVFSVDVIHHVTNRLAYFQEAYRILKKGGMVCTVTDSEWIIRNRQPLATYFPESVKVELKRYPRIEQLRALMEQVGFKSIFENISEFSYKLRSIQAYEDKAFSSLHFIPEEAFQRGISRMKGDLQHGSIPCISRYLLLWGTK